MKVEKLISEMTGLNELAAHIGELEARKRIIELFRESDVLYDGTNESGERVFLSVSDSGILIRTWQSNGYVRVDEYDEDGYLVGEIYDSRWDK